MATNKFPNTITSYRINLILHVFIELTFTTTDACETFQGNI